jgi:osmoprotectant transport system permease protein
VSEQLALLPEYATAHLQLALVALALGTLVSVPLGIAVTRRKGLEPGVLGVASVIQTIPSLALLAVMVPTLAAIGVLSARLFGVELRSIGYLPAVTALSLYSVLPILRNTVAGIEGVDPALVEAARGVGMTDRQRLVRVELPLALPVIVAGLRTAAVWVVGTATLSTPVGATSLGNYIFSGLQTRNFTAVWVGCIASAALALLLDQAIRGLEAGFRRRDRRPLVAGAAVITLLYALAGGAWLARAGDGPRSLRIGAKAFTEQYILSELLALQVERETGRRVRVISSLGSTVAFDALRSGEIDAYVDYSGTLWATILHRDTRGSDRARVLAGVERALAADYGVRVVAALGFENAYALAMRRDRAEALGLVRISDLVRRAPEFEIGGDYEFFQRPEWAALVDAYGLRFRAKRSMDPSLMYQAVRAGEVDVISAFSSDGRIAAFDLRLLEDDRAAIPPYDAIVLARADLAPEVIEALAALDGLIDAQQMRNLNLAVDRDGRTPADVARGFLRTQLPR